MRVILLALAILAACMTDAAAQSTPVPVPATLSAALAEYGCVQFTADAEVLRKGRRWWISLKPFTGGDADFAFYCQIAAADRLSRLVVIVRGENNPWRGCPAVVDSEQERFSPWFPHDLVVRNVASRYSQTDLGQWWLVSSSRHPRVTYGPAGVKVPDPIIDTIGDGGAGTLYACYSRQWYRIGLD